MYDIPPMDPCPTDKRGRHELAAIMPSEDEGDATLFCERCGAMRRFPATGELLTSRIDDLTTEEIEWRARK